MNRNRKVIIQTVKIGIGIACLGLISWRLYDAYTPQSAALIKDIFLPERLAFLSAAFILIFVNWGLETRKWLVITNPIEKISAGQAWKSVWAGVCVGNLTPGRLGEFAGRMMYFSVGNRAKAATSHFVCGLSQLLVTMVFGCVGLVLYSKGFGKGVYIMTLAIEGLLLIALGVVFLRINRVLTWLLNLTALKKFNFEGLSYNRRMLWHLVGLSAVRYVVFSLQFMFILFACGVRGDFDKMAGAISIMYLVLSTLPMISVIEVAVRAYVAVILFGMFNSNEWVLTAAATLLWLFNIVLPSVAGYFFILRTDFKFSEAKNGLA